MQRRFQFAMYTYETKAFLHRMLMLDTRICGHISCRVILKQRTRLNRIDKGYVTRSSIIPVCKFIKCSLLV